MRLGQMIKQARKGRFNQKQLGETVGVWDTYIGQIEKGEKVPSDELCLKLAKVLGLDPQRMLLMAYIERASGFARELFLRIQELLDSPAVEYLISEGRHIELELLQKLGEREMQEVLRDQGLMEVLRDPEVREALKDRDLQKVLRDPRWREVLSGIGEVEDKDIPGLLQAVSKMDAKQWQALFNMVEVLAPSL
ncbi:MAG TPA: XRE family transcriptional regulator [Candidatus Latescibacteria bacterium]|nr:XRE family transcriptional regulator [Candidatus Latescibacterota bacterium]